jgi:hypothetical protein
MLATMLANRHLHPKFADVGIDAVEGFVEPLVGPSFSWHHHCHRQKHTTSFVYRLCGRD